MRNIIKYYREKKKSDKELMLLIRAFSAAKVTTCALIRIYGPTSGNESVNVESSFNEFLQYLDNDEIYKNDSRLRTIRAAISTLIMFHEQIPSRYHEYIDNDYINDDIKSFIELILNENAVIREIVVQSLRMTNRYWLMKHNEIKNIGEQLINKYCDNISAELSVTSYYNLINNTMSSLNIEMKTFLYIQKALQGEI